MGSNIINYITDGYVILVPVLYIIGEFIKRSKRISVRYIPLILMCIGIVFGIGISFVRGEHWLMAVINGGVQGILTAGAAVLSNQIFKQMTDKQNSNGD